MGLENKTNKVQLSFVLNDNNSHSYRFVSRSYSHLRVSIFLECKNMSSLKEIIEFFNKSKIVIIIEKKINNSNKKIGTKTISTKITYEKESIYFQEFKNDILFDLSKRTNKNFYDLKQTLGLSDNNNIEFEDANKKEYFNFFRNYKKGNTDKNNFIGEIIPSVDLDILKNNSSGGKISEFKE